MTETLERAITIHQPYAWAVAAGHKPVENRTWRPPLEAVGKLIGIHAGLRQPTTIPCECGCGVYRHDWPGRALGIQVPAALGFGALIGVARLVGVLRNGQHGLELMRGRSVADALDPVLAARIRPWWRGPWGWLLEEAVLLPEPIPMRGQQGLWRIPRRDEGDETGPRVSEAADWALEQWRKARETR